MNIIPTIIGWCVIVAGGVVVLSVLQTIVRMAIFCGGHCG